MDMSGHLWTRRMGCRRAGVRFELPGPEGIPEEDLTRLARLAARAIGAKSAAISFLDQRGQWCIVRTGVAEEDFPLVTAFCCETISLEETMVVEDAQRDPRFSDSPLVMLGSGIRSFASTPILCEADSCLGTFCVFDSETTIPMTAETAALLEDYASLVSQLITLHRQQRMGEIAVKLAHASPEAVVAADKTGTIVYWNPGAEKMFGYPASQAIGQDLTLIVPDNFKEQHKQQYRDAINGAPTRHIGTFVEFAARHAQGHDFPVEVSIAPWGEDDPQGGMTAIIRDISDRKEIERDRNRISAFLDTIVQNLPAMLFVKDTETRKYVLVNRKAEALVGRTAESMIGHSDSELFPGIGEDYERRDALAAESATQTVFESEFERDDGEKRCLRTTRIVIDGPDRPRQYLLGLSEDTTEIRKVEDENRRLARYDSMTGLLNRASFFEYIRELTALGRPFALFTIDLDRFKAINDQFGHPVGDEVLKVIAGRIAALLNGRDIVARMGGDEFIVILNGDNLRERAKAFGEQLIESVAMPVHASGKVAHLGVSAGVVIHPEDADTIEGLRECSDLALYRAKNQGRNNVCFFEIKMDETIRRMRKLEADLWSAIENEDIFLRYQPIVCARTGKMTSVEALARWKLEGHGSIPPEVFIPLAEDCGLIEDLGRQLLHRACTDALSWPGDLQVAVNLSPVQFRSGKLVATVQKALESSGLPHSRLLLEVTERLVIAQPEETFLQLQELREQGVHILLDDFGVGHSSLSYFQKFPFDKIKIDKSFTDEIESSHAAKAIVEAVVGLGRNLGMDVVAEGVETERQSRVLKVLGCSHLQGYYFSRSLAPELVGDFSVNV